MALWKKIVQPPSPKKEIRSPQYRSSSRKLKSSQPLATRHPQKKKKKKKKKKKNRIGDQKWEIVEIPIGIFFIQGVFKSYLKKTTPP